MKNFVGSKGGSGIAQWIISEMPPHGTYVESFLGKGVVMKTKLPAACNIGIERDPTVISNYWGRHAKPDWSIGSPEPAYKIGGLEFDIYEMDALQALPSLHLTKNALVYADPPYLSRKQGQRAYYNCELLTVEDHDRLLSVLTSLEANVMISGYQSDLYAERLKGWRTSSKWTVNRRGHRVQEWLWMNFEPPALLHDTRFIGEDFTGRQAVKRKIERWKNKFLAMGPGERWAILEALNGVMSDSQP